MLSCCDEKTTDTNLPFYSLMTAAAKGDIKVVKLLLGNGADADLKDKDGETAIIFARQYRRSEVVELLEAQSTAGD